MIVSCARWWQWKWYEKEMFRKQGQHVSQWTVWGVKKKKVFKADYQGSWPEPL